mmetsp:Transcript_32361/g.86770  ORF Transcript_32361/g.86770 Transcript_32361/m.86770 type:complete len:205 (+) Transcript_32361:965-1579(+)
MMRYPGALPHPRERRNGSAAVDQARVSVAVAVWTPAVLRRFRLLGMRPPQPPQGFTAAPRGVRQTGASLALRAAHWPSKQVVIPWRSPGPENPNQRVKSPSLILCWRCTTRRRSPNALHLRQDTSGTARHLSSVIHDGSKGALRQSALAAVGGKALRKRTRPRDGRRAGTSGKLGGTRGTRGPETLGESRGRLDLTRSARGSQP